MKSLLLTFLSFLLLCLSPSFAQITIVDSDMPAFGEVITTATDTSFAGIDVGNAGANQTIIHNV